MTLQRSRKSLQELNKKSSEKKFVIILFIMVSVCLRFKSYITGQNSVVFFFLSVLHFVNCSRPQVCSLVKVTRFNLRPSYFFSCFQMKISLYGKNILGAFFNFLLYDDRHANLVLLFAFQNSLTVIKEAKM